MQIQIGRHKFVSNHELRYRGQKAVLGRTFEKNGVQEHVFYCPICRKDMPGYKRNDPKTIQKLILEKRWDFELRRALHCGSSTCFDYQEKWNQALERRKKAAMWKMYDRLKRAGLAV